MYIYYLQKFYEGTPDAEYFWKPNLFSLWKDGASCLQSHFFLIHPIAFLSKEIAQDKF